jgi:8-oxo-dGTP pyrophosphatase MutT (NUDIX family)
MARSGYVARIREKIDRDLLMLHAVSIFVFDEAGRFLMAQPSGADIWITIGGGVEPDEALADAAVREFWEETGALVRPTRVLGVFGGPEMCITYPNGDLVAYTSTAFEAELVSGVLEADGEELQTLRWVAPHEVASLPMADGMRFVLESALAARDGGGTAFKPATWTPPQSK